MAASIIGSLPPKVQIGEKFRLDLSRTYIHVSEHNIHLLQVTIDSTTWDISTEKYFDYDFSTSGSKTISVYVESSGAGHPSATKDFTIEVVSQADEKLFSKDTDIIPFEPDLYQWLPEGKADYRYVHRLAQTRILAKLDEMGIHDEDGEKLTIDDITDIGEFTECSKFMVLRLIFESLSNQVGDIFHEKARRYMEFEEAACNRVKIRLDLDNDGAADEKVRALTRGIFRV